MARMATADLSPWDFWQRSLDSSMAVDDSACRSPFTNQMPRGCGFARESALVQGQADIQYCGAHKNLAERRPSSYPRTNLASMPARPSSCTRPGQNPIFATWESAWVCWLIDYRVSVGRLAAAAVCGVHACIVRIDEHRPMVVW